MLTVLVWAPCAFIFIVSPLDVYYTNINKFSHIPWGFLNISRLVTTAALIVLSFVELIMAAAWATDGELSVVHLVTPAIKIVTFVSKINHQTTIIKDAKNKHFSL